MSVGILQLHGNMEYGRESSEHPSWVLLFDIGNVDQNGVLTSSNSMAEKDSINRTFLDHI